MQPFTTVSGQAAWLRLANIDTDVIVRIERLTGPDLTGIGEWAFEALRYLPDGSENPDFVLNRAPWRGAPILIAGPNFGCGSSREAAVNALMEFGIMVVVAPSFGDIFHANCFQNGLLPIVLDEARVTALGEQAHRAEGTFTVDLEAQQMTAPDGETIAFDIDPHRRTMLLSGLDEIRVTLRDADAIRSWQQQDRVDRPWNRDSIARDRDPATSTTQATPR